MEDNNITNTKDFDTFYKTDTAIEPFLTGTLNET
jgi:hypothetical protein